MLVSQKRKSVAVRLKGNIQSEQIVAKKHDAVASAMLIVRGGSTYPVPRQATEIPKAEGLINRATSANPRRISASITNISDAFISAPPTVLACAQRHDSRNWVVVAKKCAAKGSGLPRPQTGAVHPEAAATSSFDLLERGGFS